MNTTNTTVNLYTLKESETRELKNEGEEIRIDLQLFDNPNLESGSVFGTVKDENCNPILGAVVKLLDENENLLAVTYSDAKGYFVFSPVHSGVQYKIAAIANGYFLSDIVPFTLQIQQQLEINFTLITNSKYNLSVIAGNVLDYQDNPIDGCSLKLFTINEDMQEGLFSTTFTNESGQFLFADVPVGIYKVIASKLGYENEITTVRVDRVNNVTRLLVRLRQYPKNSSAAIFGVIKDNNDKPIPNAIVTLYRIEVNSLATPICYTRSNNNGVYIFTDIQPGYQYKIAATKINKTE
ncbi:Cna protein B-type domain protein [Caloramator mitchellensis]|uniref:Cna protein B-type domain protein n=1 Tax=Caloramator mitchellensis TaxID=908809 RepID=A0A0R3JRK6_CALMK|nr:carboxypeptidase-like regulatory domain-containing protein [Caloramator mitchellensis]KRQ86112.1 Cna protein B-type domain protein [Caloramator mitchellensis]